MGSAQPFGARANCRGAVLPVVPVIIPVRTVRMKSSIAQNEPTAGRYPRWVRQLRSRGAGEFARRFFGVQGTEGKLAGYATEFAKRTHRSAQPVLGSGVATGR